MVFQPDHAGRLRCVRDLVSLVQVLESDRERLHPVGCVLLCIAGDQGGIDATAKENTHLHVGEQLALDGLLQ